MPSLLPQNDPNQRLILRRVLMAAASYLLWMGIGALHNQMSGGFISNFWVAATITGVIITNVGFFLFIRSGLNKTLADPSMSLVQILVAFGWLLVPIIASPGGRGVLLMGDVMIMMFGVFSLRRRGLVIAGSFAVFGYLCVVAIDALFFPSRFELLAEILRIATLSCMMVWCVFFGDYVGSLRRTLRNRNRELRAAVKKNKALASRDDLTQVFNRRYIMDALKQEKSRADRSGESFSIVLLDLDHFKLINDRYGHLAGDRVLILFAERTRNTLRGMDLMDSLERGRSFGRYGGEEFILILPETHLAGALQCAERVRKVTNEKIFDEVFKVTLSAGVAQYRSGESIENALRRADAALYEAKNRGRDRVVAEDEDAEKEYELAIGETTATNVIIGPFGKNKRKL